MFTGLVADIGILERLTPLAADVRMRIAAPLADGKLALGESIAVDGCCLTVVEQAAGWFDVEVSHESLSRTNLGDKQPGAAVNLERAMRLGDRLGGHWVQGHVDGVARLEAVREVGESREIEIAVPAELARYVVDKGSITVSGVSLTVNAINAGRMAINLIPHTWAHTTFARTPVGARLNLEVDVLAKYVESLVAPYRR